ncbi:MAG: chloride channel protein, partial [Planctomycetaceae bacterium]|nr:chloride channel protein [Planctomycetaceae bacterium]
LATGAIGVALYYAFAENPQVLGVLSYGYGSLQGALLNESGMTAAVLVALALGKILTTSLTIGSGGSAGVFGPSMVIGGSAGGALGLLFHQAMPSLVPHPASYVIVGMAGFFAAAAKTPFSTLVMVSEITGGYDLLLPTLWVCVIAFMLSDEQSIYHEQVPTRAQSPAHQGGYARELLTKFVVADFLSARPLTPVAPGASVAELARRFADSAAPLMPVVDPAGRLVGEVLLEEMPTPGATSAGDLLLAADLLREEATPLTATDPLPLALERFVERRVTLLPVVNNSRELRWLGVVRREELGALALGRLQRLEESS